MELDPTSLHTKFLDCEKLNILSSRYSTDREDKEETRSFA